MFIMDFFTMPFSSFQRGNAQKSVRAACGGSFSFFFFATICDRQSVSPSLRLKPRVFRKVGF